MRPPEDETSLLQHIFGDTDAVLETFGADDEITQDLLLPSDELGRVTRRIAGQYVEVLARCAAAALGREGEGLPAPRVRGALDALVRLARASDDLGQLALLDALSRLLPALEAPRGSRAFGSALSTLTAWIPRFAATLEPEDARHLLALVRWEEGTAPLLDELAGIRGIGKKRLERLYAAGLFTVEAVAGARPEEIAQVTGLPRQLAAEVVERTRRFADEQRLRNLSDLRDRGLRLQSLIRSVQLSEEPEVKALALEAMSALEQALADLTHRMGGVR